MNESNVNQMPVSILDKNAIAIGDIKIVEVDKLVTINTITLLEKSRWSLKNIPISLISIEIAIIAVRNYNSNYYYLPLSYRIDPMVFETFLRNATDLKGVDDSLITKEVCLRVVKNSGHYLRFLPDKFRNDVDIIMAALEQNGMSLEVVPLDEQTQEMIDVAVKNNYVSIKYTNNKFRTKELFIDICSEECNAIKYFDISMITEDMLLEVIEKSRNESIYYRIPHELKTEKVTIAYVMETSRLYDIDIPIDKFTLKVCRTMVEKYEFEALKYMPIKYAIMILLPF